MTCQGMSWPDAAYFAVLTVCATFLVWRFARWCVDDGYRWW